MRNAVRALVVSSTLVVVVALGGCLQMMDVSGTWVGFVLWATDDSYAGETTTIQLDLLQDRRVVTGGIQIDASFMKLGMDIASGEGSNNYVTLECAGAAQGNSTTHAIFVSIEGIVSDMRIEGTGTLTVDGNPHIFTWQAQRSS